MYILSVYFSISLIFIFTSTHLVTICLHPNRIYSYSDLLSILCTMKKLFNNLKIVNIFPSKLPCSLL